MLSRSLRTNTFKTARVINTGLRYNSHSGFMDTGAKKIELKETPKTSGNKPSAGSSSGITNGTGGHPLFPSGKSAYDSYKREFPKIFGALLVVGAIFIAWPAATISTSNFVDDVPKDKGQAVKLDSFGLTGAKPVVDIPQTYSHKDKVIEDDDE